jgi:putative Ca2+/H+ antiporter (TMEM165/GDT1 family)
MTTGARVRLAWWLLVGSSVGMAVCLALWVGDLISDRAMLGITLALSWLALIFTALDIVSTQDVRRQQDDAR